MNRDIQTQNDVRPNAGSWLAGIPTSSLLAEQAKAELKTYRNDEIGFEFSYPKEVRIGSISTGTPVYPELLYCLWSLAPGCLMKKSLQ